MLSTWRYSGFNVFCGNRIQPKEKEAMETLARYIIRASFSQERLAVMCSHVPNRGEQMVRYYGYYSNVSRGKRLKETEENAIPHIMESNTSSTASRKSWARMIQKIYEVDPLICPKCRGTMRIISFIEDREAIRTILDHLGLWLIRSKPPAKAHAPPTREYAADGSCHTAFPDHAAYGDPDYSWDAYIAT